MGETRGATTPRVSVQGSAYGRGQCAIFRAEYRPVFLEGGCRRRVASVASAYGDLTSTFDFRPFRATGGMFSRAGLSSRIRTRRRTSSRSNHRQARLLHPDSVVSLSCGRLARCWQKIRCRVKRKFKLSGFPGINPGPQFPTSKARSRKPRWAKLYSRHGTTHLRDQDA